MSEQEIELQVQKEVAEVLKQFKEKFCNWG